MSMELTIGAVNPGYGASLSAWQPLWAKRPSRGTRTPASHPQDLGAQ